MATGVTENFTTDTLNSNGDKFRIRVQLWDNTRHNIYVSKTDKYDSFVSQVKSILDPGEGIHLKFLWKGKIITSKTFKTILPGSMVLCMRSVLSAEHEINTSNESSLATPTTTATTSSTSTPTNTSSTSSPTNTSTTEQNDQLMQMMRLMASQSQAKPKEPTYTYKQVKAALTVYLDFIRSNKQLRELYEGNFSQLVTEIMKNKDLDEIMRNILAQSAQIADAMEKGTNISINIAGTEGPNQPGEITQIDLSVADQEIVEEITSLGFDRTKVLMTYLQSNKNKNQTIEKLLNQ